MSAEPAILMDGVWFAYGGREPVLRGISLRVERGERLGLLGPNGGGKTTLLRLALGLERPDRGTVSVLGREPAAARRAGLVGVVPQHSDAELRFPATCRQVVELAALRRERAWRRASKAARARVERALELVGATAFAGARIGEVSGGQRQRIAIARAVAIEPEILVLDEPTVGVDVVGQQRFAETLARLRRELGLTVVIVSHDIRAVAATCDRIACLSRTVHYHAAPEGLTPQILAEVFQHDVAAAFGDVHVHAHGADECPEVYSERGGDQGGGGGAYA